MPTPMDALLGLVIVAFGLLALVFAFSLSDSKRRRFSLVVAGLITAMGLYHYVGAGMRAHHIRKRFDYLRGQQQVNLMEIQKRFQEQQASRGRAPGTSVASSR